MRCANHVLDNLKARQDDSASKTWDIKIKFGKVIINDKA